MHVEIADRRARERVDERARVRRRRGDGDLERQALFPLPAGAGDDPDLTDG